tara:strand:- start:57 stop:554 length:498 start_codon:yes stop_codon:yes gene_type:complete
MSQFGYVSAGKSVKAKMLVTQLKKIDLRRIGGLNYLTANGDGGFWGGMGDKFYKVQNYNLGDVVDVNVLKTTYERGEDLFRPIYSIDGVQVKEGKHFEFIEKNPYKSIEEKYLLRTQGENTEKFEQQLTEGKQLQDEEAKKVRKKYLIYGLIAVAGYFAYKKFKK